MWLIALQLIALNALIALVGLEILTISDMVFSVFITGVFGEIIGLVVFGVKFDFSD